MCDRMPILWIHFSGPTHARFPPLRAWLGLRLASSSPLHLPSGPGERRAAYCTSFRVRTAPHKPSPKNQEKSRRAATKDEWNPWDTTRHAAVPLPAYRIRHLRPLPHRSCKALLAGPHLPVCQLLSAPGASLPFGATRSQALATVIGAESKQQLGHSVCWQRLALPAASPPLRRPGSHPS